MTDFNILSIDLLAPPFQNPANIRQVIGQCDEPSNALPCAAPVFDRVVVDFMVRGQTRIQWFMNPHFLEDEPWSFQLQTAESDLPEANWANVGAPVVDTFITTDAVQRVYGKSQNAFYRVIVTTADLNSFTSPAATILGKLDLHNWLISQEIIRKENLRLSRLKVGTAGFFMKAKQSGTPCPACLDQFTHEVTDSNCPTCFGTRWSGGYYSPITITVFGDVSVADRYTHRELGQGEGMVNPQITKGIFVALPYVEMNDIFVNATSDLRYWIHSVKPLTQIRGVTLIAEVELRPVPFDNHIYDFTVPDGN